MAKKLHKNYSNNKEAENKQHFQYTADFHTEEGGSYESALLCSAIFQRGHDDKHVCAPEHRSLLQVPEEQLMEAGRTASDRHTGDLQAVISAPSHTSHTPLLPSSLNNQLFCFFIHLPLTQPSQLMVRSNLSQATPSRQTVQSSPRWLSSDWSS